MLVELQAWLANDHAMKASVGCLWARVCHLGLTLKKSRNAPPSRTALSHCLKEIVTEGARCLT